MLHNEKNELISVEEYVVSLYDRSEGRTVTLVYDDDDVVNYPVCWDRQTAQELGRECELLVDRLTELGNRHEALQESRDGLPDELLEVWNTYVRPFPDQGVDREVMAQVFMKEEMGEELTVSEQRMQELYVRWRQENALERLPVKACSPEDLIIRAKRYEKLVSLKAPKIILEHEVRCLAEEWVLYHCVKPFQFCRCCGNLYELEPYGGMVQGSICPVCQWEEDGTPDNEYSDANDASLYDYQRAFAAAQME